ncbi:MAG: hypothetical protein GX369_06070 [Euryarchaeota archaeon]|nr:hypothetical protein [Euryarchaeota archaeon]
MVSVSRAIPYQEIVNNLNKEEGVAIISCNACANYCRTGGRRAMTNMSSDLEADGFNVVISKVIPKACILTNFDNVSLPDDVDTVLMMACVSGLRAANRVFSDKRIISSNETLGIGYYDSSKRGSVLVSPYSGYQDKVGKVFPNRNNGSSEGGENE